MPTSILATEAIRFDPPLPDKVEAAAGLPLGVDDKLFISLSGPLPGIEPDIYLVGSTTSRETMSYQVRPLSRPAIYCFFGGRFAAALEREGEGAMFSFAAEELAQSVGERHPPPYRAARLERLVARPVGARLLFLCAARPCRRPRAARRSGRQPAVLRRRGVLAQFLLDRARRLHDRGAAAEAALASLP